MVEVPRNKGNFVQPGYLVPVVRVGGAVVSHDGTLACDEVYSQNAYPVLFGIIGTTFNNVGKGDDAATQFRTPPPPSDLGVNFEWRVRF